jgi:hypothetical protein
MEEYIVTLWRHEDLADFYDDMETEGGNLYIPDRSCNCCQRRPISRNTKYDLTEDEADLVRQDERVRAVTKVSDIPEKIPLSFSKTGNWNKGWVEEGSTGLADAKNWAIYRSRIKYSDNSGAIDGWYPGGPMRESPTTPNINSTITYTDTGKHVDVVIVDGSLDPNHPEVALNEDGTGGSSGRVKEIEWNDYTAEVGGSLTGPYPYVYSSVSSSTNRQIQHGASCATQVGGNRQGHAPECNLYNIWPYSPTSIGLPSGFPSEIWDYIRAFHNNKSINPLTGTKNPTICNASIGFTYTLTEGLNRWPTRAVHNGVTYGNGTTALTNQQMEDAEICAQSEISGTSPNRSVNIVAGKGVGFVDPELSDIEDMIADGVHLCTASGNDNVLCEKIGSTKYNGTYLDNTVGYTTPDPDNATNSVYFHQNRGITPNEGILVGAISGTPQTILQSSGKGEMPIYYSNRGDGVDIYGWADFTAAGVNNILGLSYTATDSRNSSYFVRRFNGTSSACPNVVGILACILERFPDMNPAQLKEYMFYRSRDRDNDGEIGDDGRGWPGQQPGGWSVAGYDDTTENYSFPADETNPKVMMNLSDIRPQSGRIETKILHLTRKTSGAVYPRQRTARTYRTKV